MSTFILTVSTNNPPDEEILTNVRANHETPQDEVLTVYTDDEIPGGFAIVKDDNLAEQAARSRPELTADIKTKDVIEKQKRFLRQQAKYSKDTSLTEGAKPYGNKPRTDEKMDSRGN